MEQIVLNEVMHVALKDLVPSNNNVRTTMNEENMVELMQSITQVGLLTPLIVVQNEDDSTFIVVAGHRRLEALTRLHTNDFLVPVIVRGLFTNPNAVTQIMLIENLQREGLTPLDEAKAFKILFDSGLKQGEIATKIGKSQSFVSQRLNLLTLPDEVLSLLSTQVIKLSDAVQMIGISDESLKPLIKKASKIEAGETVSFNSYDMDSARRNDERLEVKKLIDNFKLLYTVLPARPDDDINMLRVMKPSELDSYMPSDADILYETYSGIAVAEYNAKTENIDPWDVYQAERTRINTINKDLKLNYKLASSMVIKSIITDKKNKVRQPMLNHCLLNLVEEMYDAVESVESVLGLDFKDDEDAWRDWLTTDPDNVIQALLICMYEARELDEYLTPFITDAGVEPPTYLAMPDAPPDDDDDFDDEDYE
jgi:ParB/RepB/Spo0J family partition protein